MEITVLGRCGAFPAVNGACSGYLVRGEGANILVDAGSGSVANLFRFVAVEELSAIILSHLHFDHVSDLLPLSYAISAAGKTIDVYLPFSGCPMLALLKSVKVFNLINLEKCLSVKIGEMSFFFAKMAHAMTSYAVKIVEKERVFVYSGDTTFCDELLAFCANADCLLLDVGKTEKSTSHMTMAEAAFVGEKVGAKILATHLMPGLEYPSKDGVVVVEERKTYVV